MGNKKNMRRKRSDLAIEKLQEAKNEEELARIATSYGQKYSCSATAEKAFKEADELLSLDSPLKITTGNEALPPEPQDYTQDDFYGIRETLDSEADFINTDASNLRVELLSELNCLAAGVDAAQSIDAKNSLEKMLAHQMAVCHKLSLDFISKAENQSRITYKNLEATNKNIEVTAKLANISVRLMNTFNNSLRTFQKLRTGGKQVVTVQHVNISDRGQAIVAGKMDHISEEGGIRNGGKTKNKKQPHGRRKKK